MESFHKSIRTPSSPPPHTFKAPRAPPRRFKDPLLRPSAPSSPSLPSSVSRSCDPDASPPSPDLKFKVIISQNDEHSSRTRRQSDVTSDGCVENSEKGCNPPKRAPGCDKFVSIQSLRERSDVTERVSDSNRDNSARQSVGSKRGRADDHHSRVNISEQTKKSVMKEEEDVDGMVASRKHAGFDKKNGRNGDNRLSKGQAEPSALHREDLQEEKSASKSLPMRDPGAQMHVDRVSSPKEKKSVNVGRLPLKKAFKTLRALNEVGNSSVKKSEHGSSSGGENTGPQKRAPPLKPVSGGDDDGEHAAQANVALAECGSSIQEFPIKLSHISKRARSHRERRSHEKAANKGGHQEDSEGKPEGASKREGVLAAKEGEDSDARVQGEDCAGVSSKWVDTKEEAGSLELTRTIESGNLALEGDSKKQHASHEGAKASDKSSNVSESIDATVPAEMVASVPIMNQEASEMESQGAIHSVVSHGDGKKLDTVYDRQEHEMVGEQGRKTCSEVLSVDGGVGASTATEMCETSQGGSTHDFFDKGHMGKDNHANQISGSDASKQSTLSLFTKCVEAEGPKVKELTMMQDLEGEKLLQRAHQLQACSIQSRVDEIGKMGDDHASHGHAEKPFKSGSFQLSLAVPGTSNAQAVSHTSNVKAPVAPARSFQSPSRSQSQAHSHSRNQTYSDGFTTSFSGSFLHNPSCSLDGVSLDNQELSCGGSRQWSQDQRSWQTASANEHHGLVSLSQDRSKHRPGIPLYQWNLQNGSMHGFPSASGSNRICENNHVSQRNHTSGQTFQVDSKILDLSTQDLEGPARQGTQRNDLSGGSSHQGEAALHLSAARETRSEPLAQRDRERNLHHPASPARRFSDTRGDLDEYGGKIGLHEIATEPVAVMAQKMQELPDSFLEGLKLLAKDLIGSFQKREEFLTLQSIIKSRTDLTEHTLLHAQLTQLEILVAFKTGLQDFVQEGAKALTYKVLTEIFLQTRCRNTTCQQSLPVDGCECKICSEKKGFCHECMCVVCTKFDSDNQTCRWVGCDICMHWCHTDCGLRMSYIASARSSRDAEGSTEMQYQCVACGHHSELFGFVKEVFHQFAESWGAETLTKELDCVRRIFHGSEDARGKQLCRKVEEMLHKLEKEVDTAKIQRSILQYFSDVNANQGTTASKQSVCTKINEPTIGKAMSAQAAAAQVDPNVGKRLADDKAHVMLQSYERALRADKSIETAELQVGMARRRAEIESMVRMKHAEANMLQLRADEAHREARGLQQIIIVKQEKIEDEYLCKYTKLRLKEAEEKRSKRFLELQALESAQLDYERMKHRMEAQIQDLAMKMEMANWQYA